jgi:nicotinate (nicotinamide) nucleotide adenylyltransferase
MKIGIYSGTFDPVHIGHLEFAISSIKQAKLDKVYFLPERQPRHKPHVSTLEHRIKMLGLAIAEQGAAQLEILHLVEDRFSIEVTLPELEQKFAGDKLFFLFGSDVYAKMLKHPWLGYDKLAKYDFLIGIRHRDDFSLATAGFSNKLLTIIKINKVKSKYSSTAVRYDIKSIKDSPKASHSVVDYSVNNKLYN